MFKVSDAATKVRVAWATDVQPSDRIFEGLIRVYVTTQDITLMA